MTNEIQRFDIIAGSRDVKEKPTSFRLCYDGAWTIDITYQASSGRPSAAEVQNALTALPNMRAGNVVVTNDGDWGYVCSFGGELADQDLPQMDYDDSLLGGTIQMSTVINGVPVVDTTLGPVASIELPCTLQQFENWLLQDVHVFAGGRIHEVVVTSDGSSLTLSKAQSRR